MNRREFLQSLLAIASSITLPIDSVAAASDEVVDQVWKQLQDDPFVFYVINYGTLTSDKNYDYCPRSRSELYGLQSPSSLDDVQALAIENRWIEGIIEDALHEAEVDRVNQLNDDQIAALVRRVDHWLEAGPDERDAEHMTLSGMNGQGDALWYFRDSFEYCDEFNIVIVEGDCPGSSYFAAELRMPVEDANELAEAMELPIRFQWID